MRLTNNIVERTFRAAYNQAESKILPILAHAGNMAGFIAKSYTDTAFCFGFLEASKQTFPEMFGFGALVGAANNPVYFSSYMPKPLHGEMQTCFTREGFLKAQNLPGGPYNAFVHGDTISFCYFLTDSSIPVQVFYEFPLSYLLNVLNRETRQFQSRFYLFNPTGGFLLSTSANDMGFRDTDLKHIKAFIDSNSFGYFNETGNSQAFYLSRIRGTKLVLASVMHTHEMLKHIRTFYIVAFLMAALLFAILAYMLQRIIVGLTRPLLQLSEISRQIEMGKLHTTIPEFHNDEETEQLANTLRALQGRMQKYVSSLNTTLKEKRLLAKDLSVAGKIQFDMLPPPDIGINDIPGVDIYSKMVPARGVAGDFYDYFFIDDNRLFFVLGDVSGKGIPAALFMVKAMTLLQVEARKGKNPGQIFTAVNEQLTFRNDEGMFVTAVCGIINLKTGETLLCDAGHHQPLTNAGSQTIAYRPLSKNMPLGILIGGRPYQFSSFQLIAGETIILYSDGLPEAANSAGEMLGLEKVGNEISGDSKKTPAELAVKIWGLYNNHTRQATGNDDVTLFIMKYTGDEID